MGLHFDGCKQFRTANKPDGKTLDADGDLLLLLGEESPTLSWIEVEDNDGAKDRYEVSVTAAAKVRSSGRKAVTKKPATTKSAK